MAKVYLDPGHGGRDPGARGVNGRWEKESNLAVALLAAPLIAREGHVVLLTREWDIYVSLAKRAAMANNWGADVFVSLHADASSNRATRGHHAIRSIHAKPGEGGDQLANLLVDKLTEATGRPAFSRRVWSRPSERSPGRDYYAVIRETRMPAVILERGFLTHAEDAALLFDEEFLRQQAEGIARAVIKYFGLEKTRIIGQPVATLAQARGLLRDRNPDWVLMADLYWQIARIYQVRADVALAQACKETGYFKFGGDVLPEQNNFAGLGATGGGARGASFPDRATGVEAHVQHLYCYASEDPLPAGRPLVDPRWEAAVQVYGRGSAPYVEDLGGKWAPSSKYGRSIVEDYLEPMLAIEVEETVPLAEYQAALARAEEAEEKLRRIREIVG